MAIANQVKAFAQKVIVNTCRVIAYTLLGKHFFSTDFDDFLLKSAKELPGWGQYVISEIKYWLGKP